MDSVRNALVKGSLVRGVCEVCGVPKVEAHHEDYNKPLKVRWLCRKHHREWHEDRKAGLPVVYGGKLRKLKHRIRLIESASGET
jgi:hypothetical protein